MANRSLLRAGVVLIATLLLSRDSASAQQQQPVRVARGRVVGIYDETTGRPIVGVQVTDIQNGLSTESTETGTLSLFFVDTSGSMLRFRKVGYAPLLLAVTNSPSDSTPLTVLLHPTGVSLPAVVSKAHSNLRGPADTVRRLDLAGFYDRKATTGAPGSSFVTWEKIERLHLVTDVSTLTGRAICRDNLYIDGARVSLPAGAKNARNLHKDGIDQWVDPSAVLAIEMYRLADTPAEYMSQSTCGATLIWTK